ncbi:structural maintenance of chromosomes protein 6 [Ciona intestinalis]
MTSKRKHTEAISALASKRSCTDEEINLLPKNKKSVWGILESISLRNFMCHTRLSMRFSGGVNFIVGHNGSGKSAVLTAIVVALGGKASSTSRGTSLKTLIKTGTSSAVVEITLRNNGDESVKPEVYGPKITVERRITADGQSQYKIKSSTGKVVSTKKEDLLTILDEINLHVDNPLTCLNQEMSKNFLHSKNESDKYKFFLKSTQLDQMSRDYRFIKQQQITMKSVLKQKEKAIPDLKKDVLEKERRFKDLASLQELKAKVEDFKGELAWAHVVQLEHSLKPTKRDLDKEKARTVKYDAALKKCAENETGAQAKFESLQKLAKEYQEQIKSKEPGRHKAKKLYDETKVSCKALENNLARAVRSKREVGKDKREMEMRIQELKNSSKVDTEGKKQEREEKCAQLNERVQQLQAQLKTVSHDIEQYSHAVNRSREQISTLKSEEANQQQEHRKLKQTLNNLVAGKKNKLQLFGPKMPEFVKRIEDAFMKKKFRHKPRGPIGSCLTLKDQSLAVPVEAAIKSYLHAFVVENHNDEKILMSIRNSVFSPHERARIAIYTMKFSNQVYNVSHGRVIHPLFSSVLDLLVINDPVVANCLIDLGGIETILVIPENKDALSTIQHYAPPKNCTKAYTKLGDEVFVDRWYSNRDSTSRFLRADVEEEVRKNENMLKSVVEELNEKKRFGHQLDQDRSRNEREFKSSQQRRHKINDNLKKLKVEIRKLEAIEDPQPIDVRDLEDEVNNYTQQLTSLDSVIEEHTQQSQQYSESKMKAKQECDEISNRIRQIAEKAEELKEKIDNVLAEVDKAKSERKHYEEGKVNHLSTIKALEVDLAAQQNKVEVETKKASIICKDRIETRRAPSNIENEIRQIHRRIEAEESKRGDHATVVREFNEARQQFTEIKQKIKWSKKFLGEIDNYLDKRQFAFNQMRSLISMRCTMDFNVLLNQRGFKGKMVFKHEEQMLYISVKPHDTASLTDDLRALSGGERSFSTVCYILALWQAIQSPIRCLDEFDVFMDMANRRVAMDMMVEMALLQKKRQFIFLTPHDISALPKSPEIHVWKMADPDRAQTTLPFERN